MRVWGVIVAWLSLGSQAGALNVLFGGDGSHIRSAYPIARELARRGQTISFCLRDSDWQEVKDTVPPTVKNWCAGYNEAGIRAKDNAIVRATTPRAADSQYLWPLAVELAQWILFSKKSDWWFDAMMQALGNMTPKDKPDVFVVEFSCLSLIDFAELMGSRVVVYDTMVVPTYITSLRFEHSSKQGLPFSQHANMFERFYSHALQLSAPLLRLPAVMYLNYKRWGRHVGLICDLEDYWLRSTVLVAMTAPGVAEPSALPSSVVYVGTIVDEHSFNVHDSDRLLKQFLEDQLADSMPVVYVSMGTRAQLSPDTVHVIAEALASPDWAVVWAVPASYSGFLPEDIVSDQDKFYICQYCPQLAALNHTVVRAHVTHGGAHSLAESYAFGVPVLVIPQFTDQPHNAAIARDRGAGLTIDMPLLTAEAMRNAIKKLLSEETYAQNAVKLGQALRHAGGVTRATDVIELTAQGPDFSDCTLLSGLYDLALPPEYGQSLYERWRIDTYCLYIVIVYAVYQLPQLTYARLFPAPTSTPAPAKPLVKHD